MVSTSNISLFGGDKPWSPLDWTSSDDRVRGGSSYSELACSPFSPTAVFQGNLDIETLGGAGFASQRSTGEDRNWDLSKYDGVLLDIEKADGKQYTLTLKMNCCQKVPMAGSKAPSAGSTTSRQTREEKRSTFGGRISQLRIEEGRRRMPSHWI